MHETHLLKNILKYLENEEKNSCKKIKRVCISLSNFGSLNKEHFLKSYQEVSFGTKWQNLDIEIENIAWGPELEITRIDFE